MGTGWIIGIGKVISYAASVGASALVTNIATGQVIVSNKSVIGKAAMGIGGLALGAIAGEAASKYIDDKTKSFVDGMNEANKMLIKEGDNGVSEQQ